MKQPRVMQVKERDSFPISHEELWDSHGYSKILPEARDLKALSINETAFGAKIYLQGLVGYLPVTRDLVLDIRPRFPISGLWDMLSIAGDDFVRVSSVERGYSDGPQAAPPLILARSFCSYLAKLLDKGLPRSYERRRSEGLFAPKVHVGQTILRYASRGDIINVISYADHFTFDSVANQTLKSACIEFSAILPKDRMWEFEKAVIADALDALTGVKRKVIYPEDMISYRKVPSRVRETYKGLFTAYKLLRTGGGFTFDLDPKGQYLPSFFFKLDEVFERFVRSALRQGLREYDFKVLDGNILRHQARLFKDSVIYKVKPDLIFKRLDNSLVGLGEVKYKPKLKEADRYQVISHATAYETPKSIIFSPNYNEAKQQMSRIGMLMNGITVYHYSVDLTQPIPDVVSLMVADVAKVLQGSI